MTSVDWTGGGDVSVEPKFDIGLVEHGLKFDGGPSESWLRSYLKKAIVAIKFYRRIKEADGENYRALLAELREAREWRPIETAPENTQILLLKRWRPGVFDYGVGRWDWVQGHPPNRKWTGCDDIDWTHWQPQPDPPQEVEG